MQALRLYNDLATPWGTFLIGAPSPDYVEIKAQHKPRLDAAIDQLRAAYRSLLLDLMQRIWGIGPDLAVPAGKLQVHGFDPGELPPDPDRYW
jgi:hypothetical protein